MAIAKLSHVALLCKRSELQTLLVKLCEFGKFDPLEKEGLSQDVEVLTLSSKAQSVYSDASRLLPEGYYGTTVPSGFSAVTFDSPNPSKLIDMLSNELSSLQSRLASADPTSRANLLHDVKGVQEAALALFNDLNRMRFSYATNRLFVLEGFVPSDDIGRFRDCVGGFLLCYGPVGREEAGKPYMPSLLSNPRATSLFENITLTSGFPKYDEIDPTPVTAFVFPLFFGIMFSDLGQGMVLTLFGYALTRLYRGNYNYWGKTIMVLGSASMVTGFVRGLFFGISFKTPLNLLPFFPKILTGGFSVAAVSFWLEVSIIFGTLHLTSGYAISFLNRLESHDYSEAFLSGLPTILLYSSAVPLVLAAIGAGLHLGNILSYTTPTPFFKQLLGVNIPVSLVASISLPIFVGSFFVLILGRFSIAYRQDHRTEAREQMGMAMPFQRLIGSLGLGLLEGVVKPFEFFTNTISYVRLGILLIMGTILVSLADGALSLGLIGIPIALVANLAIMAIEAFMVYIQDLRLHIYEWFTHFYSGTGVPFEPLTSQGLDFVVHWK